MVVGSGGLQDFSVSPGSEPESLSLSLSLSLTTIPNKIKNLLGPHRDRDRFFSSEESHV